MSNANGSGSGNFLKQWAVLQTVEGSEVPITIAPTRWIEGDVLLWPRTTASLAMVRQNQTNPAPTSTRITISNHYGIFDTFEGASKAASSLSKNDSSDYGRHDRVTNCSKPPTAKTIKKQRNCQQSFSNTDM